jgi:hypothetical protein
MASLYPPVVSTGLGYNGRGHTLFLLEETGVASGCLTARM